MAEMIENLTPVQIVAELDRYIVGQNGAKRAVAIALRNRFRRRMLAEDLRDEVIPKNILMIGPTGCGKTEIARRLATLARAPFVKVEATKFTEVGYVGRDVDSMIRDLVQVSIRLVEDEKKEEVREEAERRAIERIVDILQPPPRKNSRKRKEESSRDMADAIRQLFNPSGGTGLAPVVPPEPEEKEPDDEEEKKDFERYTRIRKVLLEQVKSGIKDDDPVNVTVEESPNMPFMQVFSPGGMEEMGMDMQSALGNLMPRKSKQRSVTIGEAKKIFAEEEAIALIDRDALTREAIDRTEQSGIVFVDEIDKIAVGKSAGGGGGPDVSREGVQRDILPIIEGSTVTTKFGPVKTDHILFIAAGAFHVSKPSDLIPELQGRLPIRVELESLTESDFKRILTEPKNALTRQYVALLATEGITLEFSDEAVTELARIAADVNRTSENIGARRLHTVMERLLEDISFDAPDLKVKFFRLDAAYVREKLETIAKNEDLSRYIL